MAYRTLFIYSKHVRIHLRRCLCLLPHGIRVLRLGKWKGVDGSHLHHIVNRTETDWFIHTNRPFLSCTSLFPRLLKRRCMLRDENEYRNCLIWTTLPEEPHKYLAWHTGQYFKPLLAKLKTLLNKVGSTGQLIKATTCYSNEAWMSTLRKKHIHSYIIHTHTHTLDIMLDLNSGTCWTDTGFLHLLTNDA